MSVRVKINWDNENVVSESVRIYRADSIFTSADLAPLLTEIEGDIYEYEDLGVVEGLTYYYMLSAKLGEQEVFTECFEVKVSSGPIDLSFVSSSTSPARDNTALQSWPLVIPKHAKDDIVIVVKYGSDNDLVSYGFTQVDTYNLSGNYMRLWYKVAKINQVFDENITLSSKSDKYCIVLRPKSPVSKVEFILSNVDISVTGNGESSALKAFQSPFADMGSEKGYFLQLAGPAFSYTGLGRAQTITVGTPATLLLSPKVPTVYSYASTIAVPTDTEIKSFNQAAFGQVSNGYQSVFGGYSVGINYFSDSGGVVRFLNVLIVGK